MSDSGRAMGDCRHGQNKDYCHHCLSKKVSESHEEIRVLRTAIKVMIGRRDDVPWDEVSEKDVDSYTKFVKEFLAGKY